ncbi:MAG: hypothetical protein FJX47_14040 [Alphaproteobacteria bacterium]|nr:hypothetical protein [Alphaproteobacteria bacterium]
MCGIFGIVTKASASAERPALLTLLERLFVLSETRGGEASGLAVRQAEGIDVFRSPLAANRMIKTTAYRDFVTRTILSAPDKTPIAAIGHCRLVTNGTEALESNNQPVEAGGVVGVHNGIVVNDAMLWAANPRLSRRAQVDTEIVMALIGDHVAGGLSLQDATTRTMKAIEGETSIACFAAGDELALATNTGSLYWTASRDGMLIFASEGGILASISAATPWGRHEVQNRVAPARGLIVDLKSMATRDFDFSETKGAPPSTRSPQPVIRFFNKSRQDLRRCTRCILPSTFPFIEFDAKGVCSYCRDHEPIVTLGREALERRVAPHRRRDGRPDCIVAFSGGRDSCYGLHLIRKELGLNPLAFTYDWGMVTDIARRNQSRLCGRLGVEHLWRTADIRGKRRNIRANLEAWLARPSLGMIPLFTAGDKAFYAVARKLRRETGIPLVIFCAGNRIEETKFKTGFAGVRESRHLGTLTRISLANKSQLATYYAGQVLANPRYLNRSIGDSAAAFFHTYVVKDDFLYLYHYLPWDETSVVRTLVDDYGWETASDTSTTWRIGDGTAAFYNFVYHTVAGFSEHDTLRSNQIREGMLSREEALRLIEVDNRPRIEAIREYAMMVGVSADEIFRVVGAMPKLY